MSKYIYLTENELINMDKVFKIEKQKFNSNYFLIFYLESPKESIVKIEIPKSLQLKEILLFINQETRKLIPSVSLQEFIKKQLE